jgi:hypothetical protein
MFQKTSMKDGSDRDASNIAWAILKQVERIGDYKHNMFLNSTAIKEGLFQQQVAGYAKLVEELENLMWPILEGDLDYQYEVDHEEVKKIGYPKNNDAKQCFEYVGLVDEKYKIISKRFWRFGLMPIVSTNLNMITRTQKYDKFKQRIKAQAMKYLDMYGEDLVDYIKEKRDKKEAQEMKEADYSIIYRDFLKSTKMDYDDMEEDVLAFVEEN